MSQQFCANCGAANRAAARFCRSCGQSLARSARFAPQPSPSAPEKKQQRAHYHTPPPSLRTGRLPPQSYLNERYLILGKVGQGGMGAVYQAVDTRTNQLCAVKEMSDLAIPTQEERDQAVAAFHREAELLSQLRHENLPWVSDSFEVDDRHYLVMEYVEGETLDKKLARGEAPIPEETLCAWTESLCNVLDYLHNQPRPIIFRDIKPGNIMIDKEGRLRLIDFGIVRFFKPGKNKDTTLLGTPGYAAPEQYGTGQTDPRSDVYSLGATLFHLATGREPNDFPPYKLPPVRSLNPSISQEMEEVITRALEPDVADRWPTVAVMGHRVATSRLGSRSGELSEQPAPVGPLGTQRVQRTAAPARPTTRLLVRASGLSTRQLVLGGLLFLAIVTATLWLLTPILQDYPWFWRNVPTIALIAPLAYAAARRQGVIGAVQAVTALAGGAVIWMRSTAGDYERLLAGALLSALLMEAMVYLLKRFLIRDRDRNAPGIWQREMLWLALTAVVGHVSLALLATGPIYAFNPIAWISAALLGALGWFLGDLIYGYIEMRQTGFSQHAF